jgi:hypothetical protein
MMMACILPRRLLDRKQPWHNKVTLLYSAQRSGEMASVNQFLHFYAKMTFGLCYGALD